MKVYTIIDGEVRPGALVEPWTVDAGEISISLPTIQVGEEGRGRQMGYLPVNLAFGTLQKFQEEKKVRVYHGTIAYTQDNYRPILQEDLESEEGPNEQCLVVFKTTIGHRGGNKHTGDWLGWTCLACKERHAEPADKCPNCGNGANMYKEYHYKKFPGKVLVRGVIAQGIAGYMGSGEQLIAVMNPGKVFRICRTGRLYGAPSAHYFYWTGEKLIGGITRQERELTNILPPFPSIWSGKD